MTRQPGEYVAAAIRRLRERSMTDCAMRLSFGGVTATVTRIGSPSKGGEELTEAGAVERLRAVALAADFPCLEKDDAVRLDGKPRIVTSARTDPSGASLFVGFGAEMCETRLEVVPRTGSRNAETLHALVSEEDERLAFAEPYGGARGAERVYTVLVREDDWHRPEPLDVGDAVRFDSSHGNVRGAVSRVRLHRGCFILTVLERGA